MVPATDPTIAYHKRMDDRHNPPTRFEMNMEIEKYRKAERLYEWGQKLKDQKDARHLSVALSAQAARSK